MTTQMSMTTPRKGRLRVSPRARRTAQKLGLDIAAISGSGFNGRIVEADVLRTTGPRRPVVAPLSVPTGKMQTFEVSAMRMAVARRTTESFSTVPHFYVRAEADVTALLDTRRQLLEPIEKEYNVRITLTDFVIYAQALALRDHPLANRIWQNDKILQFPACNIGILVSLDDGLLIPVVAQADQLGLVGLASKRAQLVAAARAGKMPADNQTCPTAVSNLGTTRVDDFIAIIPPPQSSVLAIGHAAPRPYVVEGQLAVRQTMHLCLSIDHRVLDGMIAGNYLGRVVELLENPALMLVKT